MDNSNYDGIRNWKSEYNGVISDLRNFNTYGQANLLSKLRELKTSKLGIHYSNENSYQKKIIDDSHGIDTNENGWNYNEIESEKTFDKKDNNYCYFYLKDGYGEINNIHFSGKSASFIFYPDNSLELKVKPKTTLMKFYYKEEKISQRVQNLININSGIKFIFEKDFPLYFYTQIDATKDITFNIQFLNFDYENMTEIPQHIFEIKGYIIDSQQVEFLKAKIDASPNTYAFNGYYDQGHRVGKLVIRKENIAGYLSLNYNNKGKIRIITPVVSLPPSKINFFCILQE